MPELFFTKEGFVINGDVETEEKKDATIFKLLDYKLVHVTDKVDLRTVKRYQGDVMIMSPKLAERILGKIKPKLAILHPATIYQAREINKITGIQIVAAHSGLKIDLTDYSALSEQQALSKFIKEK